MQTIANHPSRDPYPAASPPPRLFYALLSVGLGGLALGLLLGLWEGDGLHRFLHSYLVSFCFAVTVALGALFFVAVNHVSRAAWGVTLRRVSEILSANVPVLALLAVPLLLPLLFGSHALYEWANPALRDPASEQFNAVVAHKQAYLNVPFFVLRAIGYFAIWWLLTRFFLQRSVEQDTTGEVALTERMERWSGPALILFALTLTFASFDWLMSLEPEWFSTIFGLYVFAGSVVSSLSAIVLFTLIAQRAGHMDRSATVEHLHDMGKLMLAFVVFWGYMAFSQYMLIWYANLPEETFWYLERQTGNWVFLSVALLCGHLLIPFFGLLSREVKRRRLPLAFWAIWLLVFHWIDLYWLVMPSLGRASPPFGLLDLAILVGIASLFVASVVRVAAGKSLVPCKDPRLPEALAFENF